mmetsp:Transcript_53990/g.131091  ORF Transcript_53990/g.131091 Transcript_53990/m.131091 type:complete len:225 (+) Transcript_53990:119-793(+)
MAATTSSAGVASSSDPVMKKEQEKAQPPPPEFLFLNFLAFGAVASFVFGRRTPVPGELFSVDGDFETTILEVCPSIVVICIFLTTYNLYDAMGCGLSKLYAGLQTTPYNEWPTRMPESVYVAERIQSNQLEQMTPFIVSTLMFSWIVNGTVGAMLATTWVVLRRMYAYHYRSSVGKKMVDKNLGMFTIPCYFIINTMSMGTVVHLVRYCVNVYLFKSSSSSSSS